MHYFVLGSMNIVHIYYFKEPVIHKSQDPIVSHFLFGPIQEDHLILQEYLSVYQVVQSWLNSNENSVIVGVRVDDIFVPVNMGKISLLYTDSKYELMQHPILLLCFSLFGVLKRKKMQWDLITSTHLVVLANQVRNRFS